jgi:hypothetical protein
LASANQILASALTRSRPPLLSKIDPGGLGVASDFDPEPTRLERSYTAGLHKEAGGRAVDVER